MRKCYKTRRVRWLRSCWSKWSKKQVRKIRSKKKWQTKYPSFSIPYKNWKLILRKVSKSDMKTKAKCFKSSLSCQTSKLKDKPWRSICSKRIKNSTKWNRKLKNIEKMYRTCPFNLQTWFRKSKEKTTTNRLRGSRKRWAKCKRN